MEIDFIKILVVSHEKLVNTFKTCLFIAWHYQEGQLIHVVGRGGGDVPILVVIYCTSRNC